MIHSVGCVHSSSNNNQLRHSSDPLSAPGGRVHLRTPLPRQRRNVPLIRQHLLQPAHPGRAGGGQHDLAVGALDEEAGLAFEVGA